MLLHAVLFGAPAPSHCVRAVTAPGAVVVTSTVTLYLALLAVVAELAVAVAVVLVVVAPDAGRRVAAAVRPSALTLAFCVAAVATAGSLYFSEVAHFLPCRLCWYQRIGMYPLVPMLGLAAWRRDLAVRPYALALSAMGSAIATYHVLLERFPSLETSACEKTNPCTLIWVKRFGYLTIPTMALSAFALIVVLLVIARPRHHHGDVTQEIVHGQDTAVIA
jgi:disulfide bond formation protein DsbB